jgi:hypothetical protein
MESGIFSPPPPVVEEEPPPGPMIMQDVNAVVEITIAISKIIDIQILMLL